MIKISRVEAYQSFDETDFSVMDDEIYLCFTTDQRKDREQTQQFFLLDETTIILEIYWAGELVHTVSFENKAKLTERGREQLVEEGDEGMETIKNTVEELVTGTNRQSFVLSTEMIKLKVIQDAIANLMEEVDDIKHEKWDEDPTMARLSINEIRDKVRLIDMAFYPLFLTFRDDVNKLEEHASELFDIIIKQSNSDEG